MLSRKRRSIVAVAAATILIPVAAHLAGFAEASAVTGPAVTISSWSTSEGPTAGDHDIDPKTPTPRTVEPVIFRITNTGSEDLRNITVTDTLISGAGPHQRALMHVGL